MTAAEKVTLPPIHTQVCLVSAQATPNLLPLLDAAMVPKRLVMLVTPDMTERAQWLADVARPRGIAVETVTLPDAWDMHDVSDRILDWLAVQPDGGRGIALNVTGGTKPMAMAAQQAFEAEKLPIFYVHHERDEVLWLTPRAPSHRLSGRLKLDNYLHAHGWQVVERPAMPRLSNAMRQLTQELVINASAWERALGRLNWYAAQCETQTALSVTVPPNDLQDPSFATLLDKFERAGALSVQGQALIFPSEEARFFCNGGWLEDYVAGVLEQLRGPAGLQDLAANLKVRTLRNRLPGDAGSNELDVAFLARNRLHIIECKTRSFRERHSAAEACYKLDALTAMGGLNTRAMLVSYRRLNDGDRQRAQDLRIQTVVGSAIAYLRNELLRWLGGQAG